MYARITDSDSADDADSGSAPSINENELDADDIEFGDLVGRGAYSAVYKGKWEGATCALKYYTAHALLFSATKAVFTAEVEFINKFSKTKIPNTVEYYGVVKSPYGAIVMEYMPAGSLKSHIDKMTPFSRSAYFNIMLDVTKCVRFLHKHKYLHDDIKPENILLTDDLCHAKLCDFGLTVSCEEAKVKKNRFGTPVYSAPELYPRDSYNTKKTDIYSLGLTFWSFTSKEWPFDGFATENAMQIQKLCDPPLKVPANCSRRMVRFFEACWDTDPKKRPSAKGAYKMLEKARGHKKK